MKSSSIALIISLVLGVVACSENTPTKDKMEAIPAEGQVNIFKGNWGVPHIYAKLEEDGFYGLGYSVASDQLHRFMIYTLSARGELAANVSLDDIPTHLAEGFGSVDQMIESDYQVKLWRLPEFSKLAVDKLDPQLKKNYQSYVDGVMAYMDENPDKTPSWAIRGLTVADMVSYGQFILWGGYQAGVGVNDCRRSGAQFDSAKGKAYQAEEGWSNQWAVMPHRTATGGAILLTDPHGGIDGRFTYEYRLHAGEFNSTGYAMGPMMIVSRNANVGWAATTGSPDVADCYAIETLTAEKISYKFDGEIKPIETRDIEIGVKGGDSIKVFVKYTNHNGVYSPVVAEGEGKLYVVSTPYIAELEGFHNSVYWMNKSKNVDEFRVAAYGNFPQNFLAADTGGDIMYIHAGLTPIRPNREIDWTQPQSGNSSEFAWTGLHGIDDLLTIKSPPSGYLSNNNIDTRFMDKTPHIETKDKPEYILHSGMIATDFTNSRGFRALEVLSETDKITEDEAISLAFDVKSVGAERWINLLKEALVKTPASSSEWDSFKEDLLAFDGILDQTSTSALKYFYWREAVRKNLNPENLQNLIDIVDGKDILSDEFSTYFVNAIDEANVRMKAAPKGLGRTYGDEFRTKGLGGRSWPLSGGAPISMGARQAGVNECQAGYIFCPVTLFASYSTGPNEAFERFAVSGSRIMRIDFYGPDGIRSYSAQNPGISDDPTSINFDNQTEKLFTNRKMKPVYFKWEALEPNIKSSVTLNIGSK